MVQNYDNARKLKEEAIENENAQWCTEEESDTYAPKEALQNDCSVMYVYKEKDLENNYSLSHNNEYFQHSGINHSGVHLISNCFHHTDFVSELQLDIIYCIVWVKYQSINQYIKHPLSNIFNNIIECMCCERVFDYCAKPTENEQF